MYSTGCPRCVVLKKKLEAHNIRFSEITDVDLMLSMGIQSVPMLSVDGVLMDFASANEWLNNSVDE
jgi:predicted DsbA family dithiol-disulfide isomerase